MKQPGLTELRLLESPSCGLEGLETLLESLYEHENHSTNIFPESTADLCILTAHTDANTWSGWVAIVDNQITPDTLSSKFASLPGHITAVLVEDADRESTLYMFEIRYGDSDDNIIASGRLLTQTNKIPTYQVVRMRGGLIPANETIYARVMCATAGEKTLNVHFRYFLHS